MGTLTDRLNIDITPWRPGDESPQTIEGVILEVATRFMQGEGSRPDRTVPYLEVRDEDGKTIWGVLAIHHVLERELIDRHPQAGDLIAVRYLGKPTGKDYIAYRVVIEPRGPRHDAPAVAAAAAPPPDFSPF